MLRENADSVEKMLETVGGMRQVARADAVFGEPKVAGDKTLIPVAVVSNTYGLGFGRGPSSAEKPDQPATGGSGGGAGGKVSVRPVAIVEITPQETRVKEITDVTRLALASFVMIAWNVFWVSRTLKAIFGERNVKRET